MSYAVYTRFIVLCLWLVPCISWSAPHPHGSYTVQKGDTLWKILQQHQLPVSAWEKVWQHNPHIKDPHKLRPGDTLSLDLTVKKLSPQVHRTPLQQETGIELDPLRPFLNKSEVFSSDEIERAPKIIHPGDSIAHQLGSLIYAQSVTTPDEHYLIIRAQKAYQDPANPEDILGIEGRYIGTASIKKRGTPSELLVTQLSHPIETGDSLISSSQPDFPTHLQPKSPQQAIKGRIIAQLEDNITAGPYQVVVINKGKMNQLRPGDLLDITKPGPRIPKADGTAAEVHLAHQKIGKMMIFRVFPQVSYGLILKASEPVAVLDWVTH